MGHTKCVQNVILVSQNAQFGSKWGLSIRTNYHHVVTSNVDAVYHYDGHVGNHARFVIHGNIE